MDQATMATTGPGGRWRAFGLAALLAAPLALILAVPPIPQDLALHHYADTQAYWGIPNFMDVASNLPFLLIGAAGLFLCRGRSPMGASRSWMVFFLGSTLAFFGSVYYHWTPDNGTLLWDRVPIMIAFMGLFAGVVSEHAGERLERVLLWPALVVGIASVAWWARTDDLRLYIWAQGAPLVAIVYVLIAYRGRYTHRAYFGYALGAYMIAKVAEFRDHELYALTSHAISGHTLKHLLAALGILFIYLMLSRRQRIAREVPAVIP